MTIAGYVAPTRALVSEIEGTLRSFLTTNKIANIEVTSLPLRDRYTGATAGKHKIIYVLTQERLQLLAKVIGTRPCTQFF